MTFQSVEYVIFLFSVFVLYWTVCRHSARLQNWLVAVASVVFYGWWDWKCLGLLLLTAVSTYAAGILLSGGNSKHCNSVNSKRKKILISALLLNIGVLFFFKYYNFFVRAFVDSFSFFNIHLNASTLDIILPVGISFYTFTALSYVIDVYMGKVQPTRDAVAYFAYVAFFPSILSGPIGRAQKQLPQFFVRRSFDYDKAVDACKLFLWGAFMKLCLADRIGTYVDSVYGNIPQHNGTTLLLASVLYSIQIYADFAGYSLMAIGSGKLLGIDLQTNFLRPYFSKTVTEFWRRWHMSLTTWFRDYIYFPLGGSRCSKARWAFNIMVVFLVSGLWHGANYTFIVWGALHGVCMIIERLVYGHRLKQISDRFTLPNVLRMLLTFTIVNFAWVFFRMGSISEALTVLNKIFTEPGSLFTDVNTLAFSSIALLILLLYDATAEYRQKLYFLSSRHVVVRYATAALLVCYILAFGVLDGGSFIYFQF